MMFHMVVFQLLILSLIFLNIWGLRSDQIIGDTTNLVTTIDPKLYNHHGTLINVEYVDDEQFYGFCGASFVSRQHLVTAAHCLKREGWPLEQYIALPDDAINILRMDFTRFHRVQEAYVPTGWDDSKPMKDSFPHEIAVVKLRRKLLEYEFPSLKVLRLPEKGTDFADKGGIVIGLGLNELGMNENHELTDLTGTNDYKLRYTNYVIVDDDNARELKHLQCDKSYRMCGYSEHEEPYGLLSSGDSGGGLVHDNDVLIGVFASSLNYRRGIPSISFFSSTSHHREVIDKMVSGNVDPEEIERHNYF